MDSDYRLWLLGSVHVERAGQPVHGFESRRALALLCYLAAQGRPQTRVHLADLFWPDKPEARGRGNLSRVLNNLNALLPGCVSADRETVTLNAAACWLDIDAFDALATPSATAEALSQAIALYRDDFMAGLYLNDCPDFETWLVVERERWRQKAAAVLRALIAHHTQRGEIEAGLRYTDRLLALDPWREEAHRHKMLLLALSGQRSAALKQYETCCQMLAEELGVPPTAETEALYQHICASDEEKSTSGVSEATVIALPLVGREDDHAWLLAQWEAARRGTSGLTLVSGEAGIGKTRLVQEVLRFIAGRGASILSGRCYEFHRAVPYQAVYEALRPTLAQAGSSTASLMRLLESEDVTSKERNALFAATAAHIARMRARQRDSLVFFLDDLQWADSDALDLLHYLVRSLTPATCWFVGTFRPAEVSPDHPLTHLMQTLNHDGLLHRRALSPLTAVDVARLTAQMLNTPDESILADYLFRESEGNPFYLAELVATLYEQGILRPTSVGWKLSGAIPPTLSLPVRIQDVIMQRVQRLSPSHQYLLMLAAAYGRAFSPMLLAAAGDVTPDTIAAVLSEWQARQLAHPVGGLWDLAHDKIRAALYQSIPVPLRHLLHARLAAALEHHHPEEIALLAYHYDLAQQPVPAARYMRLAGDHARLTYAHEQATAFYQRGLELTNTPELRYALLSGLESACDMTGRRDQQRHILEELTTLVENGPPEIATPQHRIEVALRQAHYAEATSDYPAAATCAERAATLAMAAGDDASLAAALQKWGYALRRQERLPEARMRYEQACAVAERVGAQAALADSLQGLANVALQEGEYTAARAYLTRSLELCQALGDRRGEADACNILGIVAQREGQPDEAEMHYRHALALRREIGDRRGQGMSLNNLGSIALAAGQRVEARAAYNEAAALCREADDRWGLAVAEIGLAEVALAQGEVEMAYQYAMAGLAGLEQVGATRRAAQARHLLDRIAATKPTGL